MKPVYEGESISKPIELLEPTAVDGAGAMSALAFILYHYKLTARHNHMLPEWVEREIDTALFVGGSIPDEYITME